MIIWQYSAYTSRFLVKLLLLIYRYMKWTLVSPDNMSLALICTYIPLLQHITPYIAGTVFLMGKLTRI
jgi:hypothetical protein